jgi:hypothetical protein
MLQRIQTVWLLIASTLGFATLSNSISFYSGNKLIENISKFVPLNARENIFILILTVSIAVATLVAIFLYKDRKMQLKIALGIFAVSLANIGLYYLQTKNYIEGKMDLTSLVVFAIPVFLLLAARGIWKDEQLVKSVDRLR